MTIFKSKSFSKVIHFLYKSIYTKLILDFSERWKKWRNGDLECVSPRELISCAPVCAYEMLWCLGIVFLSLGNKRGTGGESISFNKLIARLALYAARRSFALARTDAFYISISNQSAAGHVSLVYMLIWNWKCGGGGAWRSALGERGDTIFSGNWPAMAARHANGPHATRGR